MTHPEPNITVKVDVTNPGQFFACCGLLELADRLWPGAEGWFDLAEEFFSLHVSATSGSGQDTSQQLLNEIVKMKITNTMHPSQTQRREELTAISKAERKDQGLEDEKKKLDKQWRESPVVIGGLIGLRIDWFLDEYTGGSAFKTWAGQQSVIDIARAMQALLNKDLLSLPTKNWFDHRSHGKNVPFNFDSSLGGQGSDIDVGFSFDPLGMPMTNRPLIELLAFIGLQRCRPIKSRESNTYRYCAWTQAICSGLAGAVSAGIVPCGETCCFEFRLLYRTKYLKSFLPSTPIGDPK